MQVDIEVPNKLYDKFSEMAPLFVVQEMNMYKGMNMYKEKTGRKTIKGTKKLLGEGEMIEDLNRHKKPNFTCEERAADNALRSPLFDDLEEIGGAY